MRKLYELYEISGEELRTKLFKEVTDNLSLVYHKGKVTDLLLNPDDKLLELIITDENEIDSVFGGEDFSEVFKRIFAMNVFTYEYNELEDTCYFYVR